MIARTWRGATRAEDEQAYVEYLEQAGMSAVRMLPGNQGTIVLHRRVGDRAEFQTVLLFDSLEHVRAFAGDDLERAVFYPDDERFLIEREPTVEHYEVEEARR